MLALEPREPPLAGAGAQVQRHDGGRGGAGRGDAREQPVDRLVVVAEVRDDRGDHDVAGESGVGDRPDEVQPGPGGGRAGFEPLVQRFVPDGDRDTEADVNVAGGCREQREVALRDRPLGEDRERCAGPRERGDDSGHQPVAALGALVGVGVGAQGDRVVGPARAVQLPAQHVGDVGLDDDLVVEVGAGVEVEIGMRVAGEAVDTRMRAAAIGVDGPLERQLRGRRDPVQGGLGEHLVERDPGELRGANRPDEPVVGVESGKGSGQLRPDRLTLPSHGDHSNTRTRRSREPVGAVVARLGRTSRPAGCS